VVGAREATRLHVAPFHVSAIGPWPEDPTAKQNEGPTHDTESSPSSLVDGALGLGTTVHVVPFHCSVRVPPPDPWFWIPTATQNDDVVHETSFNKLDADPDGTLTADHEVALTVGGEE
jgi:hypothetical protein